MSVNSGSGLSHSVLRNNLGQIIERRRLENENNSHAETTGTSCEVHVGSEVYRAQYLTNPQPVMNFSTECANGNDTVMRQIYEIDREAFADIDSCENYEDFINLIQENNLSTYVVKDDNNSILGYYQLEPVKNGDMYIDSIGLKPEYRMTRKGVNAIKYSWNEILNKARANNAQSLSLHVDASNRSLVRMYQNLGFTITETLDNYYENGTSAYFMERPVENSSVNSQTDVDEDIPATVIQEVSTVEPEVINEVETVDVEPPVLSQAEQAKILFENKKAQAKENLISMGVEEGRTGFFLDACVVGKGKVSTFNDDLFTCCKYLINLEKEYPDMLSFINTTLYSSPSDYCSIMQLFKETDENANVKIRTDVLPYIRSLVEKKCPQRYLADILRASKETENHNDDSGKISLAVLNFAVSVVDKIDNANSMRELIEICKLQNDGKKIFSENVASVARNGLDPKNSITEFHTGIKYLISASIVKDEEGNETFNKDIFDEIKYQVKNWKTLPYEKTVFLSAYSAQKAKAAGCDIATYLKYGNEIERGNFLYKIPQDRKSKSDEDAFKYEIFKACCYYYNEFTSGYGEIKTERKVGFDTKVFNLIKELLISNPPKFEDVTIVPKFINACRTQSSSWGKADYSFNREVFDKAMELKEAGVNEAYIPEMIEACKLSKYLTYDKGKLDKKEFSQEIFDKVLADVKAGVRTGNIIGALKCSVDTIKDNDVFIPERYDELKKSFICVGRSYGTGACALDFYIKDKKDSYHYDRGIHDKHFDMILFKEFQNLKNWDYKSVCEAYQDRKTDEIVYIPSRRIIEVCKELDSREIKFTKRPDDMDNFNGSPQYEILRACMDGDGWRYKKFNPQSYAIAVELLDKGFDGRDVVGVLYNCRWCVSKEIDGKEENIYSLNTKRYEVLKDLLGKGVDVINAGSIVFSYVDDIVHQEKIDKALDLYSTGIKDVTSAMKIVAGDDLAFCRMKDCAKRGLSYQLIDYCKDNNEFKDRLYKMALNLQERGFTPAMVNSLMQVSHINEKGDKGYYDISKFNYEIYDNIAKLEELGIKKDNIAEVLKACKNDKNEYFSEAYEKISELHHRGIDDKGVRQFLTESFIARNFSPEKYANLARVSENIKVLRDYAHSDEYIIKELSKNINNIDNVTSIFGEDVMNNVLTSRIIGYITFVCQCNKISEKCSEAFIQELNSKLDLLPSPELKVKRLRVIGSLADKVDENALRKLIAMIKSPEMTLEQEVLANKIFSDKETDYETKIEQFMTQMHTPESSKQAVREYLRKEQFDKKIDFPKSIEEQLAQMDVYAQQMLTNPKINLDKKLKYIDEFKMKKADMKAHPEKYITPKIFSRPMQNLRKMVMAYINIPNENMKFSQSITATMYAKFGIEADSDLLNLIHYDSKYFDKLFSSKSEFQTNFKRLIDLVCSDKSKSLTQLRMELPEVGTSKYNEFQNNGLLEQIQANLDTKRQFEEQNLDFNKWNSFDRTLKGEVFTVEADPETEFQNFKFNLINMLQDDLYSQINPEETQKLTQHLTQNGFVIFNNEMFKSGSKVTNNDIETFAKTIKNYIDNDKFWKTEDEQLKVQHSQQELDAIAGFKDHLNNILGHIEEMKGAKTVHDIYIRLSDSNDIGRNIFFGNHVGCCNSVESDYAGYSAPMHLLNAYNRGIELVDKFGNSYGNSNCFFAMVDGKLTFVIDSFEANGKLHSDPLVTDNLIAFGKQVCEAMGRSDAQVMIGPNYNNIDKSRLVSQDVKKIKILGSTSAKTYCDSVGGHANKDKINNEVADRTMYIYQ